MDCLYVRIPPGKDGKEQTHIDVCLICGCSQGEPFPLLWSLLPGNSSADITQGKALLDELMPFVEGHVQRLIVDRGFMSGEWVSRLKQRGVDTVIGLRSP